MLAAESTLDSPGGDYTKSGFLARGSDQPREPVCVVAAITPVIVATDVLSNTLLIELCAARQRRGVKICLASPPRSSGSFANVRGLLPAEK
jgi:hypothetical protein